METPNERTIRGRVEKRAKEANANQTKPDRNERDARRKRKGKGKTQSSPGNCKDERNELHMNNITTVTNTPRTVESIHTAS